MKFKVDENLPVEAAELLRQEGHETLTVSEQALSGSPDADIASACRREGRDLVTLDKGFADIRLYPPEQFPGLIVLRLDRQDRQHVLAVLGRLLSVFSSELVEGHLWIVEEERIRIRG